MTDSGCKEKDSITLSALHLSCLQSQHRIDKAVSAATSLGWILAPVDYSSCSFSVLVLGKHFPRHLLSPSILSWDSVCLKRIFIFIHWALDGRELLPAEDLPYCPGTEEVSLWTVREPLFNSHCGCNWELLELSYWLTNSFTSFCPTCCCFHWRPGKDAKQ